MLSALFAGLLLAAAAAVAAEPSDEELMLRYGGGDSAAFTVLFRRYEGQVFRFVLRRTGSRARAEELAQEVFFRMVRRAPSYEPTAKFRTWIFTIARNLCIDESRKAERGRMVSFDEPVTEDGSATRGDFLADASLRPADGEPIRAQFRAALLAALQTIPDEQREVFELRVIADLRFPEIAQMLGLNLETVKARFRYACQRLRVALGEYADFHFVDDGEGGQHG